MILISSTFIIKFLGLLCFPGSGVYYISKYRGEADKKFKHTKHNKFGKKALIWEAICSCINESTLNSQIYVKECLQKR